MHQRNHPHVTAHLAAYSPDQLAVTIISFEEQVRGRLAVVRRARDLPAQTLAYSRLGETLQYYAKRTVLLFDHAAAIEYARLRQTVHRVGTQDLKIAAIALSVGGVVVTRNRQDFGQVPGLAIEDWTSP